MLTALPLLALRWFAIGHNAQVTQAQANEQAFAALPQPCGHFAARPACLLPRCRWQGGRCTGAPPPPPWTPPAMLPTKWNMSGITYTGGRYCPNVTMGSPAAQRSLAHLATTGANWVAIVVTQYQWQLNSTEIFPLHDPNQVNDTTSQYYEFVTLTDAELRAAIRQAHSLGLRVMLKPHIDLLRDNKPRGRFWRGDVGGCPEGMPPAPHPPAGVTPFTSSQWATWFASYSKFIGSYAALAQAEGVEMLAVNTELYCPNKQEEQWRRVVAETRKTFHGLLTVAAIAGHEEEMQWWDAVDVIGIDAYYNVDGPDLGGKVHAWRSHLELGARLHQQYGKLVAFTEIGYCSGHCKRTHTPTSADYATHAEHYTAVFEALRNVTYSVSGGGGGGSSGWFLGSFWWNWNTDDHRPAGISDDCLTPQWKPAEVVLRKYYRATAPQPDPPAGQPLCMGAGACTC